MVDVSTAIRVGIIALFTMVETAALVGWLRFVRIEPVVSIGVAIGLGILVAGLIIEHILTDIAVNGVNRSFPVVAIIEFSISETVLWIIWFELAVIVGGLFGLVISFLVLAVLLIPQHTIEDNVLQATNPAAQLVDFNTTGVSIIEAAGATVWLGLVLEPELVSGVIDINPGLLGLGILAVSLFIEHSIGVRYFSR